MKKRWICLFVENEIGVLAKISGLFSGKSYNLDSLTVGTTEDKSISRMTISLTSDDKTFEQIKKQLKFLHIFQKIGNPIRKSQVGDFGKDDFIWARRNFLQRLLQRLFCGLL